MKVVGYLSGGQDVKELFLISKSDAKIQPFFVGFVRLLTMACDYVRWRAIIGFTGPLTIQLSLALGGE